MKVDIHPDLAQFLKEMCEEGYTNNIVEKGIFIELTEAGYTEKSVYEFTTNLRLTKECSWNLLELASEALEGEARG